MSDILCGDSVHSAIPLWILFVGLLVQLGGMAFIFAPPVLKGKSMSEKASKLRMHFGASLNERLLSVTDNEELLHSVLQPAGSPEQPDSPPKLRFCLKLAKTLFAVIFSSTIAACCLLQLYYDIKHLVASSSYKCYGVSWCTSPNFKLAVLLLEYLSYRLDKGFFFSTKETKANDDDEILQQVTGSHLGGHLLKMFEDKEGENKVIALNRRVLVLVGAISLALSTPFVVSHVLVAFLAYSPLWIFLFWAIFKLFEFLEKSYFRVFEISKPLEELKPEELKPEEVKLKSFDDSIKVLGKNLVDKQVYVTLEIAAHRPFKEARDLFQIALFMLFFLMAVEMSVHLYAGDNYFWIIKNAFFERSTAVYFQVNMRKFEGVFTFLYLLL